MRSYKQLTREQRYQMYALMQAGSTPTKIAQVLGVHRSTVGRELKRNKGKRGYRPKQAHSISTQRRATVHNAVKMNEARGKRSQSALFCLDKRVRRDQTPMSQV